MRNFLLVFSIFWVFAVTLSGCDGNTVQNNLFDATPITSLLQPEESTPAERVDQIKEALSGIAGIADSVVLVEGHTAIVGLRLDENMKTNEMSLIIEVKRAIKQADGDTRTTSVTTNEWIVSLIAQAQAERTALEDRE